MPFIQVGKWIFAIQHITAINLDDTDGGFFKAVSVRVAGDDEPWLFRADTPEAKALTVWVQRNATRLVAFEEKQ